LPLTPISEFRDSVTWSKQLYGDYASSCEADALCESNGWSVLQLAMLATVGHPQDALNRALALNLTVFQSAGGNGHSLTNTIWYMATRPKVDKPLPLTKEEKERANTTKKHHNKFEVFDCGQPELCSDFVLDTVAGLYTCRQRMNWLMQERSYSELQACHEIAVQENPLQCGNCNPEEMPENEVEIPRCKACTLDECSSHLNRCPQFFKTYVCTEGGSLGGCSEVPWEVPSTQCEACCELSHCPKVAPAEARAKFESNCPPCTQEICQDPISHCPLDSGSQYLCLVGNSKSGCSSFPWEIDGMQCEKCCLLACE
jgi:hypothetical protein